MTGQAVAAAAGHNAQCGIGVYQRSCHLIYGAVATHSHYYVNAFFGLKQISISNSSWSSVCSIMAGTSAFDDVPDFGFNMNVIFLFFVIIMVQIYEIWAKKYP